MKSSWKSGFVSTEDVTYYIAMVVICIVMTAGFNVVFRIFKATSTVNAINKQQSQQYQVVNP